MIQRHAFVSLLFSGLLAGATVVAQDSTPFQSEVEVTGAAGIADFRELTTRLEREGHTVERVVVEASSINGGMRVLSEVVDDTARIDAETSRHTRQEFVTDTNGRPRLVSTLEERRVERADGGQLIIRDLTEPDVNGRSRATRHEREDTVAVGGGVFRTKIEVSEPVASGSTFLLTERVEQREHRDGDVVLELDRTTYANPTGRGRWTATERRVLTRRTDDARSRVVETVYQPDGTGNLVVSDQIVSREWTDPGGTEHLTEEVFARDIPNQVRTATPTLFQEVDTRRSALANGGWTLTRTVKEPRGGQMRVVERVVERARPGGRDGLVIEREVQRLTINGRLETTSVSRTTESDATTR